jgi:hypothetical protein
MIVILLAVIVLLLLAIAFMLWRNRQPRGAAR